MVAQSGQMALHKYLADLLTPEDELPDPVAASKSSLAVAVVQPPVDCDFASARPIVPLREPRNLAASQKIVGKTSLADEDKHQLQALLDRQFVVIPQRQPLPMEAFLSPVITQSIAPSAATTLAEIPVPAIPLPSVVGVCDGWENGRPRWAQTHFDVLLLKVCGLSIAVPLVALGHIYPMSTGRKRMPGQADWFMGFLNAGAGPVRILNTALFVMPERYDPDFLDTAKYVVSIDQLPWGLAVDEVNQPISISPEDVSWRQASSRRVWLAGTVKSHLCALLDIPEMAKLLIASELPAIC